MTKLWLFIASIFLGVARAFEALAGRPVQLPSAPASAPSLIPPSEPSNPPVPSPRSGEPNAFDDPPTRGLILPHRQPVPCPGWVQERELGDWWGWLLEESDRFNRHEALEHPDQFHRSIAYLVEREVIPCAP